MKKENLVFLVGGFAFGLLFGFGLFNALEGTPEFSGAQSAAMVPQSPAGPPAPTDVGPGRNPGGAPMMKEINGLKRRIQEHPDDVEAIGRLANIYHDVSMWEQAIEYYEMALELRPNDPDLITDMGVCYRGVQNFDRALEMFERARAADPAHWQSLFNTVIVSAFDLKRFDRAREALDIMEKMNPQPPRLAELRSAVDKAQADSSSGG